MSGPESGQGGPEIVTSDSRVEDAEDVRCWMVKDDDLRDDDELEGALYCNDCVTDYVGDGTVYAVSHEGMYANAYCHNCEVFLGDE